VILASDDRSEQMGEQGVLSGVRLEVPSISDSHAIRELAAGTDVLDVNSPYFYLLWCRDFAATSVVARGQDDRLAGFLLAFVRPDAQDTVYVWQEAVRVRGLGVRLLEELLDRVTPAGVRFLEATVTASNHRCIAMLERLAHRRDARIRRSELFPAELFPAGHETETLMRIGPF
jgi:diaminobutyrate acetyltransferase